MADSRPEVAWRSSWTPARSDGAAEARVEAPSVQVVASPGGGGGAATLCGLPLLLKRPAPAPEPAASCELSLLWDEGRPLRCEQLKLEVVCSARHLELYVDGTRRNMLGEAERGEVYLGTFRGSRQGPMQPAAEPGQAFAMSPAFASRDRDCDVLKNVQSLRVKFVSLTGDKSELLLQQLRCLYVPMAAPAPVVKPSVNDLAAQVSSLGLSNSGAASANVQTVLLGLQQTLEREMETKIARAIDAKLSVLSQRLALSEQHLLQLHEKLDTKDDRVQVSLGQLQHKFALLEEQIGQLNISTQDKETREEADAETEPEASKEEVGAAQSN